MNFKKNFLIVLFILPTISFAAEQQIELYTDHWYEKGGRSIPLVPQLSHDGNLFHFYSGLSLEHIQMQVKDAVGNIVYVENIFITAGEKQSFFISLDLGSMYVIEFICESKYFYGNFIL